MRVLHPVVALLLTIGLLGLGYLAAITSPDETVANAVLCATMAVVGFAAIGGTFLRGLDRAYWAGFALFGVGYLTVILGPWCTTHLAPSLITETALKALQARYGPYPVTQGAVDGMGEQVQYAPRQIGHAIATIVVGLIGGASARGFAAAPRPGDRRDDVPRPIRPG
jgi:hypothetical protein